MYLVLSVDRLMIKIKRYALVLDWYSHDHPEATPFPSKSDFKKAYWEWTVNNYYSNSQNSVIIGSFLSIKHEFQLEGYWEVIQRPLDRKLYHQFRVGSLPTRDITSKWSPESSDLCMGCGRTRETLAHILFVCPLYNQPRQMWLKPLCRNLGTRRYIEALRILRSSQEQHIVVAISKFLGWTWVLRARKEREYASPSDWICRYC